LEETVPVSFLSLTYINSLCLPFLSLRFLHLSLSKEETNPKKNKKQKQLIPFIQQTLLLFNLHPHSQTLALLFLNFIPFPFLSEKKESDGGSSCGTSGYGSTSGSGCYCIGNG
jgi:hypothetical protein